MWGWEGSHRQGRKRALTRSWISQHLDLGLLSLQNCEKTNFCCSSHPVYGLLLWQPELTNVGRLGSSDKNSKWLPRWENVLVRVSMQQRSFQAWNSKQGGIHTQRLAFLQPSPKSKDTLFLDAYITYWPQWDLKSILVLALEARRMPWSDCVRWQFLNQTAKGSASSGLGLFRIQP